MQISKCQKCQSLIGPELQCPQVYYFLQKGSEQNLLTQGGLKHIIWAFCILVKKSNLRVAIDFTIIFQLRGLKPKNKDHANSYDCCDLTQKVYLPHAPFQSHQLNVCSNLYRMPKLWDMKSCGENLAKVKGSIIGNNKGVTFLCYVCCWQRNVMCELTHMVYTHTGHGGQGRNITRCFYLTRKATTYYLIMYCLW